MSDKDAKPSRAILYIMLAVFAWGAMLALGAFLYGGSRQAIKAELILGCVTAFLGLWAVLLRQRANRLAARPTPSEIE